MFDGLINKMQGAQGEIKEKLERILLDGQAEGGKVKVVVNGNSLVKQIHIDEDFAKEADKEELEDLILVATNKALEKAKSIFETEMASAAKDMLPPGGIPGLF